MAQVIRSARVEDSPVLIDYGQAGPPPLPPELAAPLPVAPLIAPAVRETQAEPEPAVPEEDEAAVREDLRRQAFEEGYRDGLESGTKEARAALDEETERLRALAGSLRDALEQGIAGAEDAMVEVAFAAVCKVVGEAASREDGVRAIVREAMRQVHAKEGLVVRVSAADHALLCAHGSLGEGAKVELAADERVGPGGCLIETSGGTLDARLEVQLRQLLAALVRARDAQGE
jgi:flagellar assembly protein FliH